MNYPAALLEQAEHLVRREKKKPREASLRRSTSAAYYALFHLLSGEAVFLLGPNLDGTAKAILQRKIRHEAIRDASSRFVQAFLSAPLAALAGQTVSAGLRQVARAFLQLQEARHRADYDLNSTWNRARSRQFLQSAKHAFANWELIRKTPQANTFLLCFLLLNAIEKSSKITSDIA